MKSLSLLFLIILTQNTWADAYNDYMKKVQKDMSGFGIQMDVFGQNPFQTGTALRGYYLGEKTMLLERDAFFQIRANKLKTTEEVADFQHRVKVLRNHGNNILLQLLNAIKEANQEGFANIEGPKHKKTLDELIEECNKDTQCVADRLNNPETSLKNILVDNFSLASQVFKQIPYMHSLEANAIYQLVQLIYVEVLYSQNRLANVEFDLFIDKQEELYKLMKKNRSLTKTERELHGAMIKNTVKRWKTRIAKRKFDSSEEFKRKAQELREKNRELMGEITREWDTYSELRPEFKTCWYRFKKRKECKRYKELISHMVAVESNENLFLDEEEEKLPRDFWDDLD